MGMTIIINYENIIQLMTTLFWSLKVKKKLTINFRNIFDTADSADSDIPDSAGNGVLRLSDLKIFWGGGRGMPPDPPRGSRLWRSQKFLVPLKVAQFQFNSP